MKTNEVKCIGVWMDHTQAWLIIPGEPAGNMKQILSSFQGRLRVQGEEPDGTRLSNYRSTNNEHHKHQQEREELQSFFRDVAADLESYTDLLLFGPTTAATEFSHYLSGLKAFQKKNISVRTTDKLTPNQMVETVRKFFAITA